MTGTDRLDEEHMPPDVREFTVKRSCQVTSSRLLNVRVGEDAGPEFNSHKAIASEVTADPISKTAWRSSMCSA